MRFICLTCALGVFFIVPYSLMQNASEGAEDKQKQKSIAKEKPLRLDDDGPLLLLDDGDGSMEAGPQADNSRCHVCHLNFAMDDIAVIHAHQNIGCQKCHGECDKHIDDESWASGGPGTAPDIMYPPEKIDRSCGKCHKSHDAPARAVLKRWQDCCPEKKDLSTVVCTDCHGEHRVIPKLRKAWWDKNTRKPIKPETKK